VELSVREGGNAVCLDRIAARDVPPGCPRRGGRQPLHATGTGKVLLAHAPREVLEELVEAGPRRYTRQTMVEPGPLRRALAEVRRSGVAYAREELTPGSLAVAAPVVGADRTVVAALAVVVAAGRRDVGRLAPAVRTAAISTSRALQEPAGPVGVPRREASR
ncbi:MAG TPA: IclR family transcriptional regulator C-terminal domain-containing protein, partial [Pseudonocardia sp.]|nr:IclR family transcriptional regulator C-terminal domain-containing protein [Pseudonocardia sp.]